MCDCIDKIKRMTHVGGREIKEIYWANAGWVIGDDGDLCQRTTSKLEIIFADGTKRKKAVYNRYCPFCGTKYPEFTNPEEDE